MPCEFRSGHYYIEHRDGLPRAVFGRIAVAPTAGRGNPPEPLSGFVCDRTPFAKGHIMALELGGPDISANIVPQYGLWQGNGEWRAMETTVAGHNGHYFAAWLFYNFAGRDYAGMFQRCSSGEVFDWRHSYIPSRIDVWVLDSASTDPAVARVATALSAAVPDEVGFSGALAGIRRLDSEAPPVRFGESFYQYEMPDIDKAYWLGQHIYEILDQWWEDYNRPSAAPQPAVASGRTRRAAATPAAPARLDDWTFTYAGASAVKQALSQERLHNGTAMWDEAYLNTTVTPAFCVSSRFKAVPARKWAQLEKNQVPFPYTPAQPGPPGGTV